MRGQVEELLSHYGKIDIMVFDFSYWDYMGEKWGGTDLIRTAKRLQPGILVNDRLGQEPIKKIPRPSYAGDYHQCEQGISSAEVRDDGGNPLPWEAWFTTNNSWCFSPNDRQYKSPGDIIRAMINCVSKNANIVVNIGPDGRGNVDPESMRLLLEVGEWMALNGESVYGCGSADLPKPEWGRFTQKGRYLYAHLLDTVIGQIPMQGLRGRVKNGRVLANGAEAVICDFWNPALQTLDGPDDIFFNFGTPPQNTFPYPDFRDTVVRFELTDAAERRMLVENYRLKLEAQRKRRTPPN
jgi:alpha-L-fucosidase